MPTYDLTNRQTIAQLLQSHGLHTQKHFGQHFLTNAKILEATIAAANIQPTDTVLEIGAGIGVLTQELAQRAGQVMAFEIDTKLQPILSQTLVEYSNVELHFEDFLKTDWKPTNGDWRLVANLPYNAGSHILDVLIKNPNPPQSMTVLLQKEVADKIVAESPNATYLSNFFKLYGQASIIQTVDPNNFFPPPKVDSAILYVQRNDTQFEVPPIAFSKFLHHGFANPRKMLNKAFDKNLLQSVNIDPNQRPENLTFEQWLSLYKTQNKK